MAVAVADQLKALQSITHWERERIAHVKFRIRTGQQPAGLNIDTIELGGWEDRLAGLEAAIGTIAELAGATPSLVPAAR